MFSSACRRSSIGLAAGGGVDVTVLDWSVRVLGKGGSVSGQTLQATASFVQGCQTTNIWNKLTRVNLFCGDQLAAALVPLKIGGGNATDTNTNFVSGDYTEATGLTGNGTTKSLNTGIVASVLTNNDTHVGVYCRSSAAASGGVHIGGADGTTNRLALLAPFTDGLAYSDQYNSSAGAGRANTAGALATPFGHVIGTRTGAAVHTIYRNGASASTNATSGGVLPATSVAVFALNSNGTPSSFVAHPLGGYHIGSGLTASDAATLYTLMQAFQTTLARNV